MLLVYYRLYITYTLAGFLFDLDQSSICVEIFKRWSIEYDKTMRTNSTENISNNQKAENAPINREIFSKAMAFIYCTEQQIQSRPLDKERRKIFYSSGKKKRHTVKNHLWLTNIVVISLIK